MEYKQMAVDGTYSDSPHGKNEIDGYKNINEMGKRDRKSGKERFLKDARLVLRQVADILKEKCLDQSEISNNPAGPACSGEVTAEFWKSAEPLKRVWVEIGTIPLQMLSGRKDGVCVMARTQPYRMDGKRLVRGQSGQNQWVSSGFNSRELAEKLVDIYSHEYRDVRICTQTAAPIVLPPPFVRNKKEEIALQEAYRRANQAMENNAALKEPMRVPKEQMALL